MTATTTTRCDNVKNADTRRHARDHATRTTTTARANICDALTCVQLVHIWRVCILCVLCVCLWVFHAQFSPSHCVPNILIIIYRARIKCRASKRTVFYSHFAHKRALKTGLRAHLTAQHSHWQPRETKISCTQQTIILTQHAAQNAALTFNETAISNRFGHGTTHATMLLLLAETA